MENKREFSRAPVGVDVQVSQETGIRLTGIAHDVSMNGLYLVCEKRLPVRTECDVALVLHTEEQKIRIEAKACVARVDELGMALEFTAMDTDSYELLRNLVLYNAPDTAQADQEMKEHVGLRRQAE